MLMVTRCLRLFACMEKDRLPPFVVAGKAQRQSAQVAQGFVHGAACALLQALWYQLMCLLSWAEPERVVSQVAQRAAQEKASVSLAVEIPVAARLVKVRIRALDTWNQVCFLPMVEDRA